MARSKTFRTVKEALDYFNTLSDDLDESIVDICQFPPDESGYIMEQEDINENDFETITPSK